MRKRLGFEQLEDRRVCALNVSLSSGGTLKITGDNFSEAVQIVGGGAYGAVQVNTVPLIGVKNISIDTKGGNDIVQLFGVKIPGNLSIKTGAQSDLVSIFNNGFISGDIQGKTSINAGNDIGDYTGAVSSFGGFAGGLSFGKATTIVSNFVAVQTDGLSAINFIGGLSIKGISGAPPLAVNRVLLSGNPFGAGPNSTDVNVFGNLSISSSGATAGILLDDVNVTGKTSASLSKYSDILVVQDSFFQGNVSANFGNSNDALRINNSGFAAKTSVKGGKEINVADVSFSVFALPPVVKNFVAGPVAVGGTFPF